MAGKKGRKRRFKKSKREKLAGMPTQRTIALSPGEGSQTIGVVHTNRLLSQMNSRLYRQGRTYDVQFQLTQPVDDVDLQINLYTLPNTWFVHGAIQHAFKAWRATLQDELALTGGKHARWLDFSITPDAHGTPNSNIFYPNFWDGNSHTAVSTGYEQVFSDVTDADGDTMKFQVGGTEDKSGAGNYNILLEFARHLMSRRADSTAESGPQSYEGIQAAAADVDMILESGDEPPYDQDFGMWHGDANADSDTRLVFQDSLYVGKNRTVHDPDGGTTADLDVSNATGSRLVSRTFTAPLGIVFLESTTAFTQSSDSELALIVKAGKYKGVSSEPIFHHKLAGATVKSLR